MLHGVSAILYGKTGAVVQASETQRAFLFRPYRIAVLAFYGLFRTLAGAFPATYTSVVHHMEILRLALLPVGEIIPMGKPMRKTQTIKVASLACCSPCRGLGNALFGFFRFSQAFLVVRHIEYRSPYIHHSHIILRIQPQPLLLEQFLHHIMSLPGSGAECEHMIDEVVMEPRESQFVDKPHDDVGQPPEIHGGDKSHTFILA